MLRLINKKTQQSELWALFIAYNSKYGCTYLKTQRLLILYKSFIKKYYIHLC